MKKLLLIIIFTSQILLLNCTNNVQIEVLCIEKTVPFFSENEGFFHYETNNGANYRHHLEFDGINEQQYKITILKKESTHTLISAKPVKIYDPHKYSWEIIEYSCNK